MELVVEDCCIFLIHNIAWTHKKRACKLSALPDIPFVCYFQNIAFVF